MRLKAPHKIAADRLFRARRRPARANGFESQ
jgi:hypothetical protein